jgi:hypothetical protein
MHGRLLKAYKDAPGDPVQAPPFKDGQFRAGVKRVFVVNRLNTSDNYLGFMAELYPPLLASIVKTFPNLEDLDVFNPQYPALIAEDKTVHIHGNYYDKSVAAATLRGALAANKPDLIFVIGLNYEPTEDDYAIEELAPSVPRVYSFGAVYGRLSALSREGPVYFDSSSKSHLVSVNSQQYVPGQVRDAIFALGLEPAAQDENVIKARPDVKAAVRKKLTDLGVSREAGPVVFVNPHGFNFRGLLDEGQWADIIKRTLGLGFQVVLRSGEETKGNGEVDTIVTEHMLFLVGEPLASRVKVFIPKDLYETVALIEEADYVVSVQTGIGHIALRKNPTVLVASYGNEYMLPKAGEVPASRIVGIEGRHRNDEVMLPGALSPEAEITAITDALVDLRQKTASGAAGANPSTALGAGAAARLKEQLEKAMAVMEGYANYKFWDYDKGGWYTVNLLNAEGMALLEELNQARGIIAERGRSREPKRIKELLAGVPSIASPHPELFVDVLAGMPDDLKKELFSKHISIENWFGRAVLMQIGRGCYNQCAFCQFEADRHMSFIPFPIFVKLLDEYIKYKSTDQLLLHRDNDSFHYRDPVLGANLADVCVELRKRGLTYGLLTAGWSEADKVAQEAAERIVKMGGFRCDISFNLFKMDLMEAVKKGDKKKIAALYAKYKKRYANVIRTLLPVISQIGIERDYIAEHEEIKRLTWRMYCELSRELLSGRKLGKLYRMAWLPEHEGAPLDYAFLENEENKGYLIFRPYGGPLEVGYTGDKLIRLKEFAASEGISREALLFMLNFMLALHRNGYKDVPLDVASIPKNAQQHLLRSGVYDSALKLFWGYRKACGYLRRNYRTLYPEFFEFMSSRERIQPEDLEEVLSRFGEVPVLNGLRLRGGRVIVRKVWIRNPNQQFATERVFYEGTQIHVAAGAAGANPSTALGAGAAAEAVSEAKTEASARGYSPGDVPYDESNATSWAKKTTNRFMALLRRHEGHWFEGSGEKWADRFAKIKAAEMHNVFTNGVVPDSFSPSAFQPTIEEDIKLLLFYLNKLDFAYTSFSCGEHFYVVITFREDPLLERFLQGLFEICHRNQALTEVYFGGETPKCGYYGETGTPCIMVGTTKAQKIDDLTIEIEKVEILDQMVSYVRDFSDSIAPVHTDVSQVTAPATGAAAEVAAITALDEAREKIMKKLVIVIGNDKLVGDLRANGIEAVKADNETHARQLKSEYPSYFVIIINPASRLIEVPGLPAVALAGEVARSLYNLLGCYV